MRYPKSRVVTGNSPSYFDDGPVNLGVFGYAPSKTSIPHQAGATALSKVHTARTLRVEDSKTVTIVKGQEVACNACHEMPGK